MQIHHPLWLKVNMAPNAWHQMCNKTNESPALPVEYVLQWSNWVCGDFVTARHRAVHILIIYLLTQWSSITYVTQHYITRTKYHMAKQYTWGRRQREVKGRRRGEKIERSGEGEGRTKGRRSIQEQGRKSVDALVIGWPACCITHLYECHISTTALPIWKNSPPLPSSFWTTVSKS